MTLKISEFFCFLFLFPFALLAQDPDAGEPEEEPLATAVFPIPKALSDEAFMECLQLFVEPDSWCDWGGDGTVWCASGKAVVTQTASVHAKIQDFLDLLAHPDRKPKIFPAWEKAQNVCVTLECENRPIQEILDGWERQFGLKFTVDHAALEDEALELDAEIFFSVRDVPLWQAFERLEEETGLALWVGEDAIHVTSASAEPLPLRAYSIPETICSPWALMKQENQDEILFAIQTFVFPDSWVDQGGTGELRFVRNRLFCAQTQKVHRRLAAFWQLASGERTEGIPLEGGLELRVFSIAPGTEPNDLEEALCYGIEPERWSDSGSEGECRVFQNLLFVAQMPSVLEKIDRFLTQNENIFSVPPDFSGEQLKELLVASIEPDSWRGNGGEGLCFLLRNSNEEFEKIFVCQSPEILVKVKALLKKLASDVPEPDANGMLTLRYSQTLEGVDRAQTMETLMTLIEPQSWKIRGGKGNFELQEGLLLITQTPETHREIRKFFAQTNVGQAFRSLPDDPETITVRNFPFPKLDPNVSEEDWRAAFRRFVAPDAWNEAEGLNFVFQSSWSVTGMCFIIRQKTSVLRELEFLDYTDEFQSQAQLLASLPDETVVFRIFAAGPPYGSTTGPAGQKNETEFKREGRGLFRVPDDVREAESAENSEETEEPGDSEVLTMTRGELNQRIAEALETYAGTMVLSGMAPAPAEERIARLQRILEPESWRSETNPLGVGQIEKVGNLIFVRQRVRVMKQIQTYFDWPIVMPLGMGGFM